MSIPEKFLKMLSALPSIKLFQEECRRTQMLFFSFSSSEWNLYRFLVLFTEIHKLPKAVLLLKDIKTSLLNYGLEEEAIIISLKK
jgi:phosphatidate phosphatase APP1